MIPVTALRPGDRLLGEVLDARHRVLCAAGVALTSELIEAFRQHGVRLAHVAPRMPGAQDLEVAEVREVEREVAARFVGAGDDPLLALVRQTCLSVLLGTAQAEETAEQAGHG
jgi:hypothetical protein